MAKTILGNKKVKVTGTFFMIADDTFGIPRRHFMPPRDDTFGVNVLLKAQLHAVPYCRKKLRQDLFA